MYARSESTLESSNRSKARSRALQSQVCEKKSTGAGGSGAAPGASRVAQVDGRAPIFRGCREKVRPYFRRFAGIARLFTRESLAADPLPVLSVGMSHDFSGNSKRARRKSGWVPAFLGARSEARVTSQMEMRRKDGSASFAVRVQTKASRDEIAGELQNALKIRLTAPSRRRPRKRGLRRETVVES